MKKSEEKEIQKKELEKAVKCLNECFTLNEISYGAGYISCATFMIIAAKQMKISKSNVIELISSSWNRVSPTPKTENFEDPIVP